MKDVLEFIFRDFWTFLGTLLLAWALASFRFFSITIDKSTNHETNYETPKEAE